MNNRFSACAAPAAVNTAARTASAIEQRMKIPTPGRGSAAKRHCNDAEECDDQVKAALTPLSRRARQADEVADSRQAPKEATVVPAILQARGGGLSAKTVK